MINKTLVKDERDTIVYKNGTLRFETGEFTPGISYSCLNGSYKPENTDVSFPLHELLEGSMVCRRIDGTRPEDITYAPETNIEMFYRAVGTSIFQPERLVSIVHLYGDVSRHIISNAVVRAVGNLAVVINEAQLFNLQNLSLAQAQKLSQARLLMVNVSGKPSARIADAILALPFTHEIGTGYEDDAAKLPFTASVMVVSGSEDDEFPIVCECTGYSQIGLAEFEASVWDWPLHNVRNFREQSMKEVNYDGLLSRLLKGARASSASGTMTAVR